MKYNRFLHKAFLNNAGFDVVVLAIRKDCLDMLDKTPNLICIDLALSDMNYDELLSEIMAYNMYLSVLLYKVKVDVAISVEFLKFGAMDNVFKNECLSSSQIYCANEDCTDQCLENEVESYGEPALATINYEHFDLYKTDSKIVRELKAIVELAGVL